MSNPETQFKEGNKQGRGRPKSGRSQVIGWIDDILTKPVNKKLIIKELETEFKESPRKFINKYAIPLAPRELDLGDVAITALIQYNLTGPNGNDKDGKSGS